MTAPDLASIQPRVLEERVRALGLGIGLPLHFAALTASTNTDASRAASQGAPHGTLFLADRQTDGRGRLGRKWHSPPDQNVYMSLVLRPNIAVDRLPPITLVLGLAIADAMTTFLPSDVVGVKWPNDVVVRGRKLAGILVEGSVTGDRCDHVVAGVGINVLQRSFDVAIVDRATSLACERDAAPSRADVVLAVLAGVDRRMTAFEQHGLEGMMHDLAARDVTIGRAVRAGAEQGIARGIASDGRLRVELPSRGVVLVHAGDVEILAERTAE